jgi:hypothetical protein
LVEPVPTAVGWLTDGRVFASGLEYDARLEMGGRVVTQLGISGVLCGKEDADRIEVWLERHEVRSGPEPASEQDLENAKGWLAVGVGLGLAVNRSYDSVTIDPSMPELLQGAWKHIVGFLSFSPPRIPAHKWIAREFDSAGEYSATYRLIAPGIVERRRERDGREDDAQQTYTLASGGARIAGTTVTENGELVVADEAVPRIVSHTTFTLSEVDHVCRQPVSDRATWVTVPLDATSTDSDVRRELDRARMEGFSIVSCLAAVRAGPEPGRERWERALLALPAFLRQDPESQAAVETLLKRERGFDAELLDAVAVAGCAGCESLLLRASRDKNLRRRVLAARGLGRLDQPSPRVVQRLSDLVNDERLPELFAAPLATLAARSTDNEAQEAMVAIHRRIRASEDSQTRRGLIDALASARSRRILSVVDAEWPGGDETLRVDLTYALEGVPGDDVTERLRLLAAGSYGSKVARAAADALQGRKR